MFENIRTWGPTPFYPVVRQYQRPNNDFVVISGPCSYEDKFKMEDIAKAVKKSGATHLRGGVFRAGTYPGEVFGILNEDDLSQHQRSAHLNGMKNIMEVLDYRSPYLDLYIKYADCLQVGSRQMQNYALLSAVGASGKPVFLKRNQGSTLDEFLGAAEWLLRFGCPELYLIERGSSTFHNHVRWDLSISMIPAVKKLTNIPIIVDASHGTGRRDLVTPMTLAGVAAGADGILVEVHRQPDHSLSDADQAIHPAEFDLLMKRVNYIRDYEGSLK